MKDSPFEYDEDILRGLSEFVGRARLKAMLRALTEPGRRYYVRVNTLLASPGEVMDRLRDRGVEVFEDEVVEEALYFPIKGPYKVPLAGKVVVADKYAAESVLQGSNLYAPGVLKAEGVRKGDEVNVVSPNGIVVGYGIAEMDGREMLLKGKGLAVRVLISKYKVPKVRELSEFEEGLLYDQSLPAMVTSLVLEPRRNEVVVDMCSAPGGKATHVVQLTQGKAKVYAFDSSSKRIGKMLEELRRLRMESLIKVIKADSRYLDLDYPSLKADKVILDPPCSSIGVRPKVYDRKTVKDVKALAAYQIQFLKVARSILRKGGTLVYSTCTITLEENEAVIKYAVERLGFEVAEQVLYLGERGLPYLRGYEELQRFFPDRHEGPGYFIAKLIKRS
ncbi:MAG: 16S rRNA methyltransferase [Thermofilum sp. ex4484_15]|nr:MAG: 16S rRNA methyltransferase [Thermofilum sp. ex4484_15]